MKERRQIMQNDDKAFEIKQKTENESIAQHQTRIAFSEKTNLIEQSAYHYSLQERETPNLYRNLFDYQSIPKVSFNHRFVPVDMPADIWITDTTFRDGQQSLSPFSVEQIVDLYKLMHRLGGPKGIIRQSEFFVYTEKDRRALKECQDLGYEFPEITGWIRAAESDFQLVRDLGLKEIGILVSCSDYHIYTKMGLTRKSAFDKYLGIVKRVLDLGIRPRCHFEDITRADYYGFVVPFAEALTRLGEEYGIPVKIRACDTMGYGVSYPGAALPRSVPGIIYGLHHYAGIDSALIEWHGHNDFYKVVTNASTAWLYGASGVNCSLLGIGERTGNCPLEAMVVEYCSLKGTTDGMELPVITEIANYFENKIGYSIPPRTPFVGSSFNVTRAGIHADGLLKNEEIYNIFNTEKLLNRPAAVAVDKTCGLAGIAHWLNSRLTAHGAEAIGKRDTLIVQMKEIIDREYEDGRNTVMSDGELLSMVRVLAPEIYAKII